MILGAVRDRLGLRAVAARRPSRPIYAEIGRTVMEDAHERAEVEEVKPA